MVSSSVSMLVPLTIGKLIDFFSTGAEVFLGLSFPVAATLLALTFCVGAVCNAGTSPSQLVRQDQSLMRH